MYETSYNENLNIWLVCLGDPSWNTKLSITAAFLRNYTEPVSDSEEETLSKGGIAGIVIACVVGFLFIVGLLISQRNVAWFKNLFKCCKNKTHNVADDSPRDKDLERRETGLAGSNDIAHHPSN